MLWTVPIRILLEILNWMGTIVMFIVIVPLLVIYTGLEWVLRKYNTD